MTVPLEYRIGTRIGWTAAGAACCVLAAVTAVSMLSPETPATQLLVAGAIVALYGWAGLGALRLGAARGASLHIEADRLVVEHGAVLGGPIEIARANVDAIIVDPRPDAERSVAASGRRGGIVPPHFVHPGIPVVSQSPTAHSGYGSAAVPNVVIFLREPVAAPVVPWSARFLIRLGTGKPGRYRGPKTGKPLEALRIIVEDPEMVWRTARSWNVLAEAPRDARYLSPVTEPERKRALGQRLLLAGVCLFALLIVAVPVLLYR